MPDIVYWGNGDLTEGEYEAPKDVSSAAIAKQTTVAWNGGIGDSLTGIADPTVVLGEKVFEIEYDRWRAGTFRGHWIVGWQLSAAELPIGGISMETSSPSRNTSISKVESYSSVGGSPSTVYPKNTWSRSNPSQNWRFTLNSGIVAGHRFVEASRSDLRNWTAQNVQQRLLNKYLVETDSGQSVSRFSISAPNIFSQCAIAITYADNTSKEIPLSSCPEWVRVRSDEECPENTCRIDCGDHYCCYGCGGVPVLEIPK
ncbi:MAG: hypothetical protein HC799_16200 [Limnothrix sp. RL_2_0]|nr:hypothetical protein [Limnothrix sp. RL_2_0]